MWSRRTTQVSSYPSTSRTPISRSSLSPSTSAIRTARRTSRCGSPVIQAGSGSRRWRPPRYIGVAIRRRRPGVRRAPPTMRLSRGRHGDELRDERIEAHLVARAGFQGSEPVGCRRLDQYADQIKHFERIPVSSAVRTARTSGNSPGVCRRRVAVAPLGAPVYWRRLRASFMTRTLPIATDNSGGVVRSEPLLHRFRRRQIVLAGNGLPVSRTGCSAQPIGGFRARTCRWSLR